MYTGYSEFTPTNCELAAIYEGKYDLNQLNLLENQYLLIKDQDGKLIDTFIFKNKKLEKIKFTTLGGGYADQVKPRNPEQICAWDLLKREDIPIKLITGKFGSGKSMACIVAALEAVQKGKFEKIVFVRNNVQVKDTDALGSLPGDQIDKMLPYVMPFADHCGGTEGVIDLIDRKQLEVIPLGFLRGRSIRNSILYSMESENLTKQHIQLIMGRVDEGSQLWLDGDTKQRDKVNFEKSLGLETMIERLKGNNLFGYVHLKKSERSEIAQLADLLD